MRQPDQRYLCHICLEPVYIELHGPDAARDEKFAAACAVIDQMDSARSEVLRLRHANQLLRDLVHPKALKALGMLETT